VFEIEKTVELAEKIKNITKIIFHYHNPNIQLVAHYNSVGAGLKSKNKYIVRDMKAFEPESLYAPFYMPDSTKNTDTAVGGIFTQFARSVYNLQKGVAPLSKVKAYYQNDSNLIKLNKLKDLTGAEYCLVSHFNGTIKRKPISVGQKVGVAVTTGIASVLLGGGVIIVPGDETELKSFSMLINLSDGTISWSKRFSIWKVYAVENFDVYAWAYKILENIKISN
jgi:hypothetical protein